MKKSVKYLIPAVFGVLVILAAAFMPKEIGRTEKNGNGTEMAASADCETSASTESRMDGTIEDTEGSEKTDPLEDPGTENSSEVSTESSSEASTESSSEASTGASSETEKETSPEASAETSAETAAETVSETVSETVAETALAGPEVPEEPVREMIGKGLTYVLQGYGYSLNDRVGMNGNFDCSGLVASLLYTEFNCPDYYLNGDPYTTGDWRRHAAGQNVGDLVQFGDVTYRVSMKDTEDYIAAWSVPGSIVVQYSPTNHPEKTMGHISVALGEIPYIDTAEVISYIRQTYGIDLSGTTSTGLPMVYDQYGCDAGHTVWKINANSVANCVIVDNNFASDPEWIEPVCVVYEPVYD